LTLITICEILLRGGEFMTKKKRVRVLQGIATELSKQEWSDLKLIGQLEDRSVSKLLRYAAQVKIASFKREHPEVEFPSIEGDWAEMPRAAYLATPPTSPLASASKAAAKAAAVGASKTSKDSSKGA
jgi:hypothetical protein